MINPNLVPRVFRLFGQRLVPRRDSGELEFYYRRISAVKQCKPLRSSQSKHLNKSSSPESTLATNCWPKTLRTLGTRVDKSPKHFAPFLIKFRDVYMNSRLAPWKGIGNDDKLTGAKHACSFNSDHMRQRGVFQYCLYSILIPEELTSCL